MKLEKAIEMAQHLKTCGPMKVTEFRKQFDLGDMEYVGLLTFEEFKLARDFGGTHWIAHRENAPLTSLIPT